MPLWSCFNPEPFEVTLQTVNQLSKCSEALNRQFQMLIKRLDYSIAVSQAALPPHLAAKRGKQAFEGEQRLRSTWGGHGKH
jgi:hypothetical protein